MQWAICEAFLFCFHLGHLGEAYMCEDGEAFHAMTDMLQTMFLTMLATLDREGLMSNDSNVKNLGFIMALLIQQSKRGSGSIMIEANHADDFAAKVFNYATKHNILLRGTANIESELIPELEVQDKIPLPASDSNKNDPWKFHDSFKAYKKHFDTFGGDEYDITAMTAAERKNHAFDHKDPFSKEEIKMIKDGMVATWGSHQF